MENENKVVCHYCGTIYDAEQKKCPRCGSVVKSDNAVIPAQRQRITERERKQRRRHGRFAAVKEKSPKGLQIAALIFLAVAVIVVGYFIGSALGWWGGAESKPQDAQTSQGGAAKTSCTLLRVSEQELNFDAVGQTATVSLTMNADCAQTAVGMFSVPDIADYTKSDDITAQGDEKSLAIVVTALAEGETELKFTCGDKTASCVIRCGASAPPSTDPAEFTPELNCGTDLSLLNKGEMKQLLVTNLPEGMQVTWSSADATVAKVNEYGELTAIGNGQTTVRATADGKTAEVRVRCVFNLEDVGAHLEAGRADVSVRAGDSFSLFLYDKDGEHITDITYTIGDPSVCKVENGQVIALATGTTTVTVTYYNLTFPCIVRVK